MDILLVLAGFALLVGGGEALVRGAVALARRLGLSPMVIGITLVGFGTSAPELVTSITAALQGAPGVALGNVVGSNIANILLILGVAAVLSPLPVSRPDLRADAPVLAVATLAAFGLLFLDTLGRLGGLALLAGLAIYLVTTLRRDTADAPEIEVVGTPRGRAILLAILGLAATILGAQALVTGAVNLAGALGVSETVIGLTVVAVGTSLPELATTIVAARRRMTDLALGNIIGSNIFNILGILGATALVAPLDVPDGMALRDGLPMLAATAALVLFAVTGWRITRGEGAALLAGYAAYLWLLWP